MDTAEQKRAAAGAAIAWLDRRLRPDLILGVGTGSTADHFIDLLGACRGRFRGAVASSRRSAERLARHGIALFELDDVVELPIYVDGADEVNPTLDMIKGGGGALTREKIVAAAASVFVCIADATKRVEVLGAFPLPVEVIPMARSRVVRALANLGVDAGLGRGDLRTRVDGDGKPYVTDNGNWIVDIHGWTIAQPAVIETRIGAIVGVVESGIFALRGADVLLLADQRGVTTTTRPGSI